jgi:hypothetical protein
MSKIITDTEFFSVQGVHTASFKSRADGTGWISISYTDTKKPSLQVEVKSEREGGQILNHIYLASGGLGTDLRSTQQISGSTEGRQGEQ